jgi:hypothetical protein
MSTANELRVSWFAAAAKPERRCAARSFYGWYSTPNAKLTQVRRVHNLDCRSVIVDEKTPGKTKS